MNIIYPKRLQPGDHIRVIAPSLSMSIISEETKNYAIKRFKQMGFSISFEQNISEVDIFSSRSIEMRVNGLHEAFKDKSVNAVLAVIGGFNANQLLEYVDWELIKQNPKIFCGYSDITILNNAIFSQTGLINYYGPAFSTFGQKILDQYEIDYFLKILSNNQSFSIQPSSKWSNDQWYLDQNSRDFLDNSGYWVMQKGACKGTLVGGHLGTFCLLQGTKYMPSLKNKIICIEEDACPCDIREFDRRLQSLLQQPDTCEIKGIMIGRFEKSYGMTREILSEIINTKKILKGKPIIANVDFGHTEPHCTLPIGGVIELIAEDSINSINVVTY